MWVGSPMFLLQVVQLIAFGFRKSLARPWSEIGLSDQLRGQGAGGGLSVLGWMLIPNFRKHSPFLAFSSATEDSLDYKELYTHPRWPFGCGTVCTHFPWGTHPEGLQQLPLRLPTEV